MTNAHNKKLAEQGRKRRAMFYRLHTNEKVPRKKRTATALARRFKMSHQCMSAMLRRAAEEAGQ